MGELERRGIDKSTPKAILTVLVFLGFGILVAWFSRMGSIISYVAPPILALAFTAITVGLNDWAKPLSKSTDQEGVVARNPAKWIFIICTVVYFIFGLIDRG